MNIAAFICDQVPCGRLVSVDEADELDIILYECPECGTRDGEVAGPACDCGAERERLGFACPACDDGALKPLYECPPFPRIVSARVYGEATSVDTSGDFLLTCVSTERPKGRLDETRLLDALLDEHEAHRRVREVTGITKRMVEHEIAFLEVERLMEKETP